MTEQELKGARVFLLELTRRIGKARAKLLLEAVVNRSRLAGVGNIVDWMEQWELELAASASPVEIDAASEALLLATTAMRKVTA